jgi:hypothetical protein
MRAGAGMTAGYALTAAVAMTASAAATAGASGSGSGASPHRASPAAGRGWPYPRRLRGGTGPRTPAAGRPQPTTTYWR